MPLALRSRTQHLARRVSTASPFDLEIMGAGRPSGVVTGDLLEVIEWGTQSIAIAVGDACGHGVAAGMLIDDVRRLLRLSVNDRRPPGATLTQINRRVMQRFPPFRFVTFSLVTIDRHTLEVQFATAGQPLYRLPADGPIARCECDNGPLGIFDDEDYATGAAGVLSPGESLILLTDGFREALNPAHEIYGDARLQRLFEAHRREELPAIVEQLLQDVHRHVGEFGEWDDLTVAMLRLTPRAS